MELTQLGPYKLGKVIGRGGMGSVYEAVHIETNAAAAVKVLLATLEDDQEIRLRFDFEINSLKKLRHPNIVRIYGYGTELDEAGQEVLYYAMELVDGPSLQHEIKKQRLFKWEEVAKIGLDLCQALRHAHDRGVTHRDIKPANILLSQAGSIKLSDYGIAQNFGTSRITDVHSIVGTLEYMSPEQAVAGPVGPRSDLFSLGAVLYLLLTGKIPFTARSLPELIRKHNIGDYAPIKPNRFDVPPDFTAMICDLLRIKAEERPANAYLIVKRIQTLLQTLVGSPESLKVLPITADMPPAQSNSHFPADAPQEFIAEDIERAADDDATSEYSIGNTPQRQKTSADTPPFLLPAHVHDEKDAPAKTVNLPDMLTKTCENIYNSSDDAARPPHHAFDLQNEVQDNSPKKLVTSKLNASANGAALNTETKKPHTTAIISTGNVSRFVEVGDSDAAEPLPESMTRQPLISLPTALTSLALIVVGITLYYLLQPPSADTLYQQITSTLKKDDSTDEYSLSTLRNVQGKIQQFLFDYPQHPLAEQVQALQDELELAESERKYSRRQLAPMSRLTPVEMVYVDVIALSKTDLAKSAVKLQAFIDLFDTAKPAEVKMPDKRKQVSKRWLSGPVDICVELAKRRLAKIEIELNLEQEEQAAVLRNKLTEAYELENTDPQRAEAMRRAIIELYGDQPRTKEIINAVKESREQK